MTLFALRLTILSALVLLLQPALSRNISEVPLTDTNVSTSRFLYVNEKIPNGILIWNQIICYEASCNSTTDVSCLCSGYEDIWTCIGNNATSYQDYYSECKLNHFIFTVLSVTSGISVQCELIKGSLSQQVTAC